MRRSICELDEGAFVRGIGRAEGVFGVATLDCFASCGRGAESVFSVLSLLVPTTFDRREWGSGEEVDSNGLVY